MSDERDLTGVEQLLRSVPAPETPPAGLEAIAREAALAPDARPAPVVPFRRRQRFRLSRLVPAAAVVAAAAAASLVIGVGGRSPGIRVEHTITMAAIAPGAASGAQLQVGQADGAMRPVVLKVHGLAPQPSGRYYQVWFSDGGDKVGVIAFNTAADGSATVHSSIPSNMGWTRCWITLTSERIGAPDKPVLRAVST